MGPAGSCTGGFRTQAPETLHIAGRVAVSKMGGAKPTGRFCQEQTFAVADLNDWLGWRLCKNANSWYSYLGSREA